MKQFVILRYDFIIKTRPSIHHLYESLSIYSKLHILTAISKSKHKSPQSLLR